MGCLNFVKRLRRAVNSFVFLKEKGMNIHIAASYGISSFPVDSTNGLQLLRQSDQAMYRVKMSGRDNIAMA
jgi:diguanylate cyclase (GGDEF)-like protein